MDTATDAIRADAAQPGMRWTTADGAWSTIRMVLVNRTNVTISYRTPTDGQVQVTNLPRDRMICASFGAHS